jgi:hypothetical protein
MQERSGTVLFVPGIAIRLFAIDDVASVADLVRASVRGLAARDYTPTQLRAWAPDLVDEAKFGERCLSKSTWVAEIDGRVAGFSEPDGHSDMLYVQPDFTRRGVDVLRCWAHRVEHGRHHSSGGHLRMGNVGESIPERWKSDAQMMARTVPES